MTASIRPYRVPIAVMALMVMALAFWTWQAWREITEHERAMRRQFAMGALDSISGTLKSLVRGDQLPRSQALSVLESITRHSPVRFVILEQSGRRILEVGDAPADLVLPGNEGEMSIDGRRIYWETIRLQRDDPYDADPGPSGPGAPDDIALGEGDQILILGLGTPPTADAASPPALANLPRPPEGGSPPDHAGPPDHHEPRPMPAGPPPALANLPRPPEGGSPPDHAGPPDHHEPRPMPAGPPPDRGNSPAPLRGLWITASAALLFVIASLLAWIMAIRGRLLTEQLNSERVRHAHLEELGLAAAGLAHETKNPLGIISGIAQQILDDPDEPKQSRKMLEHILDEVDKASSRLGNFMAFARQREAVMRPLDLRDVCLKVAAVLGPDFDAAGVTLDVACPAASVLADEEMLRQILVNLLLNSLHASSAASTVNVRLLPDAASATLVVEDHGRGIPPDLLPDIFKPYVAGSPGGHGLGLAIARRLVEEQGWTVAIDSEVGRGTTVRIAGLALSNDQEPAE